MNDRSAWRLTVNYSPSHPTIMLHACAWWREHDSSPPSHHSVPPLFSFSFPSFVLTFFFWSWELRMFGRCDQTRQPKALLKDKIFRKLFIFFCIEFISVCPHSCTYCGHKSFQGLFALRSCVPLRSGSALFLTSTDNSFPFYPTFRGHSPQHTLISLPTHPSLVELSPFCTRSVPIKADSPSAACPANTSQR